MSDDSVCWQRPSPVCRGDHGEEGGLHHGQVYVP